MNPAGTTWLGCPAGCSRWVRAPGPTSRSTRTRLSRSSRSSPSSGWSDWPARLRPDRARSDRGHQPDGGEFLGRRAIRRGGVLAGAVFGCRAGLGSAASAFAAATRRRAALPGTCRQQGIRGRLQQFVDVTTLWPRLAGNCHAHRHTEQSIRSAGFDDRPHPNRAGFAGVGAAAGVGVRDWAGRGEPGLIQQGGQPLQQRRQGRAGRFAHRDRGAVRTAVWARG